MAANETPAQAQAGPEPAPGRIGRRLANGTVEIRTRGDAMAPLVQPGDRVRLERRAPRTGEVALIALGDRLVLHRLVRRRGQTWLVHADRAGARDAWIHTRQVVAIAIERQRGGQHDWERLARAHPIRASIRDALFGAK